MSLRGISAQLASVMLLAAWLGAAVFVAAVVAPAAFALLPSSTVAGTLIGRVLMVFFWSGIFIGLIVAWLSSYPPASEWRTTCAFALVASCVVAQFEVAPQIEAIRNRITVPIEALDPSDPRRQLFGRLHVMSVGLMGIGVFAALVILVLLSRTISSRSSS
jgi:Domain of unknown function (DUF4149)